MLRAHSEYLSELIHVFENVNVENFCASLGGLYQTSKHANGSGLTGSVVAKESENLAVVHCDVRVIDGNFLAELLSKTLDFKTFTSELLLSKSLWDIFKIFWIPNNLLVAFVIIIAVVEEAASCLILSHSSRIPLFL